MCFLSTQEMHKLQLSKLRVDEVFTTSLQVWSYELDFPSVIPKCPYSSCGYRLKPALWVICHMHWGGQWHHTVLRICACPLKSAEQPKRNPWWHKVVQYLAQGSDGWGRVLFWSRQIREAATHPVGLGQEVNGSGTWMKLRAGGRGLEWKVRSSKAWLGVWGLISCSNW